MTNFMAIVKLIGCRWVNITGSYTLIGRLQCYTQQAIC